MGAVYLFKKFNSIIRLFPEESIQSKAHSNPVSGCATLFSYERSELENKKCPCGRESNSVIIPSDLECVPHILSKSLSGCGESNSVIRMFPKHPIKSCVGVRRIELRHHAPKASVLPVYDTPTQDLIPKATFIHKTARYFSILPDL